MSRGQISTKATLKSPSTSAASTPRCSSTGSAPTWRRLLGQAF